MTGQREVRLPSDPTAPPRFLDDFPNTVGSGACSSLIILFFPFNIRCPLAFVRKYKAFFVFDVWANTTPMVACIKRGPTFFTSVLPPIDRVRPPCRVPIVSEVGPFLVEKKDPS